MAKAYDEFDNLIFQTEGEIMSDEDKELFTKKIMNLYKIQALGFSAGKKIKAAFAE